MKSIEKNSEKHFSNLMNRIQVLETKTESIENKMMEEKKYDNECDCWLEQELEDLNHFISYKMEKDIMDIKDDFKKIKSRVKKNTKTIKTLLKDIKSLKEVIEQT